MISMICCARSRSAAGIRKSSEGMAEMLACGPDAPDRRPPALREPERQLLAPTPLLDCAGALSQLQDVLDLWTSIAPRCRQPSAHPSRLDQRRHKEDVPTLLQRYPRLHRAPDSAPASIDHRPQADARHDLVAHRERGARRQRIRPELRDHRPRSAIRSASAAFSLG